MEQKSNKAVFIAELEKSKLRKYESPLVVTMPLNSDDVITTSPGDVGGEWPDGWN